MSNWSEVRDPFSFEHGIETWTVKPEWRDNHTGYALYDSEGYRLGFYEAPWWLYAPTKQQIIDAFFGE